jgi:hypothetical protein
MINSTKLQLETIHSEKDNLEKQNQQTVNQLEEMINSTKLQLETIHSEKDNLEKQNQQTIEQLQITMSQLNTELNQKVRKKYYSPLFILFIFINRIILLIVYPMVSVVVLILHIKLMNISSKISILVKQIY